MSTVLLEIGRARYGIAARVGDYVELTKPRIAVLVLACVAVAHATATWGHPDLSVLLLTLLGTAMVAASGSAMNQWLEVEGDARMGRTAERPLPAGRLRGAEVVVFGIGLIVAGTVELWLAVSSEVALCGLVTWAAYVLAYTPAKRLTVWNTAIGAVAGALPVVMGWLSAGNGADERLLALFGVLYFWQFPHFMAIAWLFRAQYRDAGLRMLTVVDGSGRRAGVQAVVAALVLIPVSFLPGLYGPRPSIFMAVAFVLGVVQLGYAVRFMLRRDDGAARGLLRASLVYLPAMLLWILLIPFVSLLRS